MTASPPPAAAPALDIPTLERMLTASPRDPNVWSALGAFLRRAGKNEAAVACQRRALELAPRHAGAWTNLGNALTDLGQVDEGLAAQEQAVAFSHGGEAPLFNLAVAQRQARAFERAAATIDRALAASPVGHAQLLWERALNRLQTGDYAGGFRDYEHRRGIPSYSMRVPPGPEWDGNPLDGRTILVATEQGFGDSLMAVRFLPLLKAQGARVIFECHRELMCLFEGMPWIDHMIPAGSQTAPRYDVHCSQMSLPARLGTTLDTLPPPVRPAIPAAARAKAERLIGPPDGTLRVGIIWSGRVTFKDNARRATGLTRFLRFLDVPRVRLYSLQKGPPEAELADLGTSALVTPLGPDFENFGDTAAALERLDLVIMTDSSVAHLAGSLGLPVWNLLQYVPYWVYGADGADTPWYPSMRLFRQERPGDWDGVFAAAERELRALAAAHGAIT